MIKAILIDDEKNALEMLEWQLENYCPQIQVLQLCKSADEGIESIQKLKPHLVFLDIDMPIKNGFEVLLHFPEPDFDIIFTTAYNQFAVKAFKYAALDYLMKPIDADDLIAAVQRCERKQMQFQFKEQLEILIQQYKHPQSTPSKLPFATQDEIVFINPAMIVHCESASNYTTLYLKDKTKLVLSKTLKEIEALLEPYHFLRIHHSHLINLEYVNRFIKADGGFIEMIEGTQVPISRHRKDVVLQVLLNRL